LVKQRIHPKVWLFKNSHFLSLRRNFGSHLEREGLEKLFERYDRKARHLHRQIGLQKEIVEFLRARAAIDLADSTGPHQNIREAESHISRATLIADESDR
jgi:hypothetical protein